VQGCIDPGRTKPKVLQRLHLIKDTIKFMQENKAKVVGLLKSLMKLPPNRRAEVMAKSKHIRERMGETYMSNTKTFWQPAGNLSAGQAQALSVRAGKKPDKAIYLDHLMQKLQELIDLSPHEARSVLEMSVEHFPELYSIAQNQLPNEWATCLAYSDSFQSLIARVDWDLPGVLITEPTETSLQSVLEQLP
jgi:hypothetical protein